MTYIAVRHPLLGEDCSCSQEGIEESKKYRQTSTICEGLTKDCGFRFHGNGFWARIFGNLGAQFTLHLIATRKWEMTMRLSGSMLHYGSHHLA